MHRESDSEEFAVTVFADDGFRQLARVTMTGEVQLTDDLKPAEKDTVIVVLGKTVFTLRNDDAKRIAAEKKLDEEIGTRMALKKEVIQLKAQLRSCQNPNP